MAEKKSLAEDLFEDMGRKVAQSGAGDEKMVEEIQDTLCMNCHESGTTKLLLTKIPFFREVVIMSFECPHCGFHNNEIDSAGEIQQRGVKVTLNVDSKADLNRQVVKSDTCIFRLEDLDLEIAPGRGRMTNVEGLTSMIAEDLEENQEGRKEAMPQIYEKLQGIIGTIRSMATGDKFPFTITVDDPAGNSWIEPSPDDKSAKYFRHEYPRSSQQNTALGLGPGENSRDSETQAPNPEIRPEYHAQNMYPQMPGAGQPMVNNVDDDDVVENQVYSFPASCPGCTKPCATNMKMVHIPYFKQVIVMSTVCDHCGYRSNEVKTGGEVPEKGRRVTLSVEKPEDLSRDILKAESCAMRCPELSLFVEPGTLGGRFTTIEGLLTQVRDNLHASIFSDEGGQGGDSMDSASNVRWNEFFGQLDKAIGGEVKFKIILEDPLASSYVQSFTAPEPDKQMEVEDYERTEEEEESLGLKDIKTEGYEAPEKEEGATDEGYIEAERKKAQELLAKATGNLKLEES